MITKQIWKIGDTRKLLPEFDDFHLCVTSPPYNVGIDYGVFKDNLPLDEYIEDLTSYSFLFLISWRREDIFVLILRIPAGNHIPLKRICLSVPY